MDQKLEELLEPLRTEEMMVQWHEILVIAGTIIFIYEDGQHIWQYDTKGIYSSSSTYNIINFRGVHPIYLPGV
jgi:hypothetical protein